MEENIYKLSIRFYNDREVRAVWNEEKGVWFFSEHPLATIDEAVDAIDNLSLGGVKFIIAKLQQRRLLKRVGGRKYGEWVVFDLII